VVFGPSTSTKVIKHWLLQSTAKINYGTSTAIRASAHSLPSLLFTLGFYRFFNVLLWTRFVQGSGPSLFCQNSLLNLTPLAPLCSSAFTITLKASYDVYKAITQALWFSPQTSYWLTILPNTSLVGIVISKTTLPTITTVELPQQLLPTTVGSCSVTLLCISPLILPEFHLHTYTTQNL